MQPVQGGAKGHQGNWSKAVRRRHEAAEPVPTETKRIQQQDKVLGKGNSHPSGREKAADLDEQGPDARRAAKAGRGEKTFDGTGRKYAADAKKIGRDVRKDQ